MSDKQKRNKMDINITTSKQHSVNKWKVASITLFANCSKELQNWCPLSEYITVAFILLYFNIYFKHFFNKFDLFELMLASTYNNVHKWETLHRFRSLIESAEWTRVSSSMNCEFSTSWWIFFDFSSEYSASISTNWKYLMLDCCDGIQVPLHPGIFLWFDLYLWHFVLKTWYNYSLYRMLCNHRTLCNIQIAEY